MHGRPRVYVRFRPSAEVKLPALKGPGIPPGAGQTEADKHITLEAEHTIKFPWKSQKDKDEWKEVKVQVDHAFTEDATQDAVYSKVGPEMLDFVLRGFRGLICTYGVTASGKTHTMLGSGAEEGLAQRLIEELFLRGLPDLTVSMQAVQLHRSDFTDLGLAEMPNLKDLKVQSGNYSDNTGAQEFEFKSAEPALVWLKEVLGRKAKAKSRSHFLLRMKIQFTSSGVGLSAVLDLADLAGCEKLHEKLGTDAKKDPRDHITIQAGLSNLRHCIEAKVKGKAVPFTYFSLPRLLAPDFCGDAGISFVINCPSLADVDRIPETSETLDLARFILRLELAYKAQKATVHVAAEDLLKAADHKRLPEAKEVEAPAVQSFQSESDKEIKKLKKKLERRSQDIKELRAQLESQRLAPRIERLSKDLDKASAEDVRQLLKEVEKRYPEILQQAWPQWAEQLDKGDKSGLLELQKAVDQHEVHLQSLQWLLQRREESHLEVQNGEDLPEEVQQLRRQQLAALDALLDSTGLSAERRADLATEAAQQRALEEKLQKKQEELTQLETSLHLAGARDDGPVKAELLEDLAAFGTDELQEAVEGLPGSTSTLQHLLLAHPSWKQRFYQLGGLEKILEKMEKTKKVFYHQRLAQCLCRILDMERVSRFNHAEIARRLVQQVLDVTTGVRFPLDANSDEARILDYMTLMEAIAQDRDARRLLVQGGAVPVALKFVQHRAQAVAAAALNALGQVASDASGAEEISLPPDALRWMLSILRSGESARMKKAAAQCLQRLCYGSSPSAQELRSSLEKVDAVPQLLAVAQSYQAAEQQVGRNDGAEVARHVKNAALLMLNDRKISDPSHNGHKRIVLEAMAHATAKSFAKVIDPDAEARREQMASQQRSLYHVSRIITVKHVQSAQGDEKDHAAFLEDLVARGFNSPLFWQGLQSAAPFMSEDVTAQHVEELDTDDVHILMLSMGTALQEKRYVVSVCADDQLELVPLSTEGWQRRSFVGQWRGSVPRSAQSMTQLQPTFPQLILTNAATSSASVCFILSFSTKDEKHVKKHSWHEEDDDDSFDGSCPDDSYPLLDMQLFDIGRHPIQRYVGDGAAVAKNRKASNHWVALGAQLPPCSTHSLVMSRCWGRAQEHAEKAEFQSFRLLVLSDCELEMQPVRCSNEWRVATSELLRIQETTSATLKLQLKDGSEASQTPQKPENPVKLQVITCADDESPAYMMVQALPVNSKAEVEPLVCPVKDGKRVYLSPDVHNEYKLSSGEWTVNIDFHPQCKPGFLLGVRVFSLCDAELQWLTTPEPSNVVPRNDAEKSFIDDFQTKLPTWHSPHTEVDLKVEDSVFPPVPKQRPQDKEMISVSMAYLQRLHRRARRDQCNQADD